MTPDAKQPQPAGRLKVNIPAGLEPTYANLALITHSPSEIVIDLAQVMPQVPEARVRTRVVMTPINAKLLQRALAEHLTRFETEHGEIKIPHGITLADQLFRRGETGSEETGEPEA
ncbi:MAG TPA: DUF3467 domain-containing protein [Anaerolineales bacterium]|jgi:hypothetical protein